MSVSLDNNTQQQEDILCVLKTSDTFLQEFKKKIENKNVFIFLGNTRDGKSTLVSYIMRAEMIAFKEKNKFKIKHKNEEAVVTRIGQGSLSHTTIPIVCQMKEQEDTVIVDAPGFDDNKGVLQDILNALYINQIKYAKAVRFVLVCDINNIIRDNINDFISLIRTVHLIVPDIDKLKESVSIIFTKEWQNFTQKHITIILQEKILDVSGLCLQKDLIQHFVDHEELIGIFRMPTKEGQLTENINVNIEESIFKSLPLVMNICDIRFGISSKARLVLIDTYMQYFDIVVFAKDAFRKMETRACERLSSVNRDNLHKLLDCQLPELLKTVENISLQMKQIHKVSRTKEIPVLVQEIFIIKVEKILIFAKQCGIEYSINLDQVMVSSIIEEMSRKFEYVECIERVIEKYDKSRNIIDHFENSVISLLKYISTLSSYVHGEISDRKFYVFLVENLNDISPKLQDMNKSYLFASEDEELDKMKSMLQFHIKDIENALTELSQRPSVYERTTPIMNQISQISQNMKITISRIEEEINMRRWEMIIPIIPPELKHWVGPLIFFGTYNYIQNKAWNFENIAYHVFASFLFITFAWNWDFGKKQLWRVYGRYLSRMYSRYRQHRIFGSSTVLDIYFAKMDEQVKWYLEK